MNLLKGKGLTYCLPLFALCLLNLLDVSELLCRKAKLNSDEGLTLETSVFESFTVANLPYRPCG